MTRAAGASHARQERGLGNISNFAALTARSGST